MTEEPLREMPFKIGTSSDGRVMHYSVGAIIEDHGAYLMMDRVSIPYGYAGMAGHIDNDDESPLAAVMREGREELGVELFDVRQLTPDEGEEVLWNNCRSATVHRWHLFVAKVVPTDLKVDPKEAKRYGWFIPSQLRTMELEPVWRHWLQREGII